jgi:hypothetical protein
MKNIDIKSLLIGGLLASTIFFGVAATSPTDKWDDKQLWKFKYTDNTTKGMLDDGDANGWEPFGWHWKDDKKRYVIAFRKRIK